MRIKVEQTLCGHPALRVRGLLRRGATGLTVRSVCADMGVDEEDARRLIAALETEGYIEPKHPVDDEGFWNPTMKGNALAMASASAPLVRTTANRMLVEFLTRIEQIRDDSYWLFKVQNAVLFGSFLSDAATLGDIDIGIQLRCAYPDKTVQEEHERKRRLEAENAGRKFSNMVERIIWPRTEVRRFLRSRSRISLHELPDEAEVVTAGRHTTIYANEAVVLAAVPLIERWPVPPSPKRGVTRPKS